ncbi:MAG TPA: hypothetical protein VFU22_02195 [Roseiflexaceae bacterium]|nr:hypothetical protein [Roseiflexaceae bacterium]
MSYYSIALFLHIVGTLGLFVGLDLASTLPMPRRERGASETLDA